MNILIAAFLFWKFQAPLIMWVLFYVVLFCKGLYKLHKL